jgi:membrane associated rhomboid family serine protease
MRRKYYTLWLILICVFIFIVQLFSASFIDLLILDSNYPLQIWRYLSSIFLHGGFSHLFFNIFALLIFGLVLESIIGSNKFLVVFFASGIIANIISINFYSTSLGASGAIYGIIGTLMIVRPLMVVWAFGLPLPMILAGALYAAGDLVGLFIPSDIGHIAHLSGIVIGVLLGFFYHDWNRKRQKRFIVKLDEDSVRNWEDHYMR